MVSPEFARASARLGSKGLRPDDQPNGTTGLFLGSGLRATARIGARWRAGKLTTLDDRPLPNIRDGAFIELEIPAWVSARPPRRSCPRSQPHVMELQLY